MTLIVGRVTQDIGFLVGDTLLSKEFVFNNERDPIDKLHALKIQILAPYTAVAFAGDVETSLYLINKLHTELTADPKIKVCERLFEAYKEKIDQTSSDCEFLVLQLAPKRKLLSHITKDGVFPCESKYIGDQNEYKRMQALRSPYQAPKMRYVQNPGGTFFTEPLNSSEGEIEFEEISDAMEKLTHSRRSETVGAICGCVIRVVDARISRELEYLQSVEASASVEEGYSGFSFLASNSGVRGIGIYYRSGKLGFLFIVGDAKPCRREQAETLCQFIKTAKEKYCLNLTGGTWTD